MESALADTSTHLCAAVADWRFPASIPEIVSIAAQVGKGSERFMPWSHPPTPPSDEELAAVHAELMEEIIFNN